MPFTLETVKDYGGTGSDGMINGRIAAFADTYACLTASYSQAIADDIANSYIAGTLQQSSGDTYVSQEKSASGASTSYQKLYESDATNNPNIAHAQKLDTAGCLPIDETQFCFGVSGKTFAADNPQ